MTHGKDNQMMLLNGIPNFGDISLAPIFHTLDGNQLVITRRLNCKVWKQKISNKNQRLSREQLIEGLQMLACCKCPVVFVDKPSLESKVPFNFGVLGQLND